MRKQPALTVQSTAIASERSVRSDYPMTWDDYCDRVGAVRQSNSAHGRRTTQLRCQPAVTDGKAGWNETQRRPDLALKIGACGRGRKCVDGIELTFEVCGERVPGLRILSRAVKSDFRFTVVSFEQALHAVFVIFPVEGTQTLLTVGDDQHGSGWCVQALEMKCFAHDAPSPSTVTMAAIVVARTAAPLAHFGHDWHCRSAGQ